MDDQLRQPYQGQLVKFTNVVKGWQTRWFVLNPELGTLHYYLSECDLPSRARGSIQLAGAVISPSDEDCHTFTVSPASGEAYKLRAQDTRDRQMWLNRLRVIAEMHTRAIAHNHPSYTSRDHRSAPSSGPSSLVAGGSAPLSSSHSSGGVPYGHHSQASQSPYAVSSNMAAAGSISSLAVLDAFTQVSELLQTAHRQNANLASAVEELPSHGRGLKCSEPSLLLLKATSQATVLCLDGCLSVLKTQQQTSALQRPRQGSPSLRSSSPSMRTRTAPHSPAPPLHHSQQQQPHHDSQGRLRQAALQPSSHHTPLTQTVSLNSAPNTARGTTTATHSRSRGGSGDAVIARAATSPESSSCGEGASGTCCDNGGGCRAAASGNCVGENCRVPENAGLGGNGCQGRNLMTSDNVATAKGASCVEQAASVSTVDMHSRVYVKEEVSDGLQRGLASSTALVGALPTVSNHVLESNRLQGSPSSDSEESDSESTSSPEGGSGDTGDLQQEHTVIVHIISQLRLGMDLTRVTLPTFILEKRSLLEMFADFLGHPDYFLKIGDCRTSEERLLAVVRWYLTSVHVGRHGSQAKKPYNPIIGETFQCGWRVPRACLEGPTSQTIPKSEEHPAGAAGSQTAQPSEREGSPPSDHVTIRFAAEQVSHHPPVSAFYFECPEKKLCINAHIWTKSKFMGMSIGVNLLGDITLTVGGIPDDEGNGTQTTDADQQHSKDGRQDETFESPRRNEDKDENMTENARGGESDSPDHSGDWEKISTNTVDGNSRVNETQHATGTTKPPVATASSGSSDSVSPGSGSKRKYRTETYSLSMPSAFARSILTEPWAELGGRVNIACLETGYYAPIVFHTKPFYGGCLHRVTGEVRGRGGEVLTRLTGEWDAKMELTHASPSSGPLTEVLDVCSLPLVARKRVRPLRSQGEGESRRLWQDVTSALRRHDLDTATAHKRRLEDMQRGYEAARRARSELYAGKLFRRIEGVADGSGGAETNGSEHWVYRRLPDYATKVCQQTASKEAAGL